MNLLERIAIDPAVRFGKPCIRGTRISVGDVLEYLAGGMSEDEILADFPQLIRDDTDPQEPASPDARGGSGAPSITLSRSSAGRPAGKSGNGCLTTSLRLPTIVILAPSNGANQKIP